MPSFSYQLNPLVTVDNVVTESQCLSQVVEAIKSPGHCVGQFLPERRPTVIVGGGCRTWVVAANLYQEVPSSGSCTHYGVVLHTPRFESDAEWRDELTEVLEPMQKSLDRQLEGPVAIK